MKHHIETKDYNNKEIKHHFMFSHCFASVTLFRKII
jgi:hypothetical protein